MTAFGVPKLYEAAAIVTRIRGITASSISSISSKWLEQAAPPPDGPARYWNAHVDEAQVAAFQFSAVLYLSTAGSDFSGGAFSFRDSDADRIVEPRAGRLTFFSGGLENVHRVEHVGAGSRFVFAMWFTTSEAHRWLDADVRCSAQVEPVQALADGTRAVVGGEGLTRHG